METFEYKTVTVDCKDMEHSQDKLTAQLNRWAKRAGNWCPPSPTPTWAARSILLWASPIGSR